MKHPKPETLRQGWNGHTPRSELYLRPISACGAKRLIRCNRTAELQGCKRAGYSAGPERVVWVYRWGLPSDAEWCDMNVGEVSRLLA